MAAACSRQGHARVRRKTAYFPEHFLRQERIICRDEPIGARTAACRHVSFLKHGYNRLASD